MGIIDAYIRTNLIKAGGYDQLYKFKINTFKNNFVNSNLIKENYNSKRICK
jgi:hypothetical protein